MEPNDRSRRWPTAVVLFLAGLAATIAAYASTAGSFFRVWRGSDTYTHCFFVLPIVAALVWRRRDALRRLDPTPFLPGLALIAGAGTLWLIAHAAGVLFYEQLALALMVPFLVLTIFGLRVARTLTFPLAFFLFAVPFGEAFHPALMSFTARATVIGLRLTGVPVSVEGLYLTTPTSKWQVVEACSGLRFLISMFTLGCLFAYLHFRRPMSRILFGALSIVVPVLANGLRAYVMVMTSYLSGSRLGVGLDHYAIGWTVFAIVMALFFYVGSRWREAPSAPPEPPPPDAARPGAHGRALAVCAVAILVAITPAVIAGRSAAGPASAPVVLNTPEPREGWTTIATPPSPWRPGYQGAAAEIRRAYERDGAVIDLYLGFYRHQEQGRELIHFANVIVPRDDARWRSVTERDVMASSNPERLLVHETDVHSSSLRYLVWHWYWLPDEFTTSRTRAKLLQARARILLGRDHAAAIILSAPYVDDAERARARLQAFTHAMLPSIRAAIASADSTR